MNKRQYEQVGRNLEKIRRAQSLINGKAEYLSVEHPGDSINGYAVIEREFIEPALVAQIGKWQSELKDLGYED